MRIKFSDFNNILTALFKDLAIDHTTIQLNGSYNHSYWASDIDLYEPVDDRMEVYLKVIHIQKNYNVSEIKVTQKSGATAKYYDMEKPLLPDDVSLVKVDMLITSLMFPIELTIIYDFKPEDKADSLLVRHMLAQDAIKYRKEGKLYKAIKRLQSVSALQGNPDAFKDVTEDTQIGVLYLSYSRLKTLSKYSRTLGQRQLSLQKQYIAEDLRKVGVRAISLMKIRSKMNKLIKSKLKKRQPE